jgi:hypothetical protein
MFLQAMLFDLSYDQTFAHTESIFNMKKKKQKSEEHFAKQILFLVILKTKF